MIAVTPQDHFVGGGTNTTSRSRSKRFQACSLQKSRKACGCQAKIGPIGPKRPFQCLADGRLTRCKFAREPRSTYHRECDGGLASIGFHFRGSGISFCNWKRSDPCIPPGSSAQHATSWPSRLGVAVCQSTTRQTVRRSLVQITGELELVISSRLLESVDRVKESHEDLGIWSPRPRMLLGSLGSSSFHEIRVRQVQSGL